jgi:hypothetical protein
VTFSSPSGRFALPWLKATVCCMVKRHTRSEMLDTYCLANDGFISLSKRELQRFSMNIICFLCLKKLCNLPFIIRHGVVMLHIV